MHIKEQLKNNQINERKVVDQAKWQPLRGHNKINNSNTFCIVFSKLKEMKYQNDIKSSVK